MDRFDSFLDDDLDPETVQHFEEHLAACPDCGAEYRLAQRVAGAFGAFEVEPCPDNVFKRAIVAAEASQNGQVNRRATPPRREPRVRRWKALALAATILLVLGLGSLPFLLNPAEAEYSAEEIAQAQQDVQFALSLVSTASRDAGVFIQNEVLGEEVVKPIQHSLNPTP